MVRDNLRRWVRLAVGGILLGAVLLVGARPEAQAQPANSPWPMFQRNDRHTGQGIVNGPLSSSPHVVWSFDGGGHRRHSPSVGADGTIYLGVGRLPVLALDPANGSILWQAQGNAATADRSQAAVGANGHLYVGARDNDLWSIDASDGSTDWRFKAAFDGDVQTPPMIGPDGAVYMATDALAAGQFYAVWPDGTQKWHTVIGGSPHNVSPALSPDQETVYITRGGKILVALDADDGIEKWRSETPARPTGSRVANFTPVVGADGTIFFAARTGVFAFDPTDGAISWSFEPARTQFASSPALSSGGRLFVGGSSGQISTFYALDADDGSELWQFALPLPCQFVNTQAAVGLNGTVYFGCGRMLYAFNGTSGAKIWEMVFSRGFQSGPILSAAGVLLVGNGSTLYKVTD